MCAARNFVVSIHDFAPGNSPALREIVNQVRPRVGTALCAAVIPAGFRGHPDAELAALVQSNCREIALHGYSHLTRRRLHPVALLTRNSSEFIGLSPEELRRRLQRGQSILQENFGQAASVLIPPAWCAGALTPAIAEDCGLPLLAGLTNLVSRAWKLPLAVYSWDLGRVGRLGIWGELLGHMSCRRNAAVPCVVLHPADVSRNLLKRGLGLIDRLLAKGYSPVTFADLANDAFPRKTWADK
jgi:predicted deacetylase